jgi:hypothetical protein
LVVSGVRSAAEVSTPVNRAQLNSVGELSTPELTEMEILGMFLLEPSKKANFFALCAKTFTVDIIVLVVAKTDKKFVFLA